MPFPYKKALVIGATSGIGLALSEKIIANGSHVIAVGRRKARLDSLMQEHGADKLSINQFDITNLEGIPSFVHSILSSHPDLDSVILNAGIQRPLDFSSPETIDLSLISVELTTNYTSYIHILKYLLPHFLSKSPNPKSIIFISSALGLVPIPKVAGYCASKAALHHLVLCVREQLLNSGSGVKVVEIVPPAVRTELHDYEEKGEGGRGVDMDLHEFIGEVWEGLEEGKSDITVGMAGKAYEVFEQRRQGMFRGLMELLKANAGS